MKITFNNYLDSIFRSSNDYLLKILSKKEYDHLVKTLKKNKSATSTEECVALFNEIYTSIIKLKHQSEYKKSGKSMNTFMNDRNSNLKLIWGDCLHALKQMDSESIQLMVTSPPYYNARDYSQWKNIDDYLDDMREIITETYRVLDNHR
ncbi:uncharacterized protein METZ01_LOCUS267814, partial [marine metagenome]